VGTPFLQQISLRDNDVRPKLRKLLAFSFTLAGYFVTVFEKTPAASLFEELRDGEEDNPHDEAIFTH